MSTESFRLEELITRMRQVRQAHDVELQQLREWKAELGAFTNRTDLLSGMILDEIRHLKRLEDAQVPRPPPEHLIAAAFASGYGSASASAATSASTSTVSPTPAPAPVVAPPAPPVPEPPAPEPPAPEPPVTETETVPVVPPVPFRIALDDLIQSVSHSTKQKDALMRLKLRHADDQMYFVNFERVNVTRGTARQKAVVGKFTILGAVGTRGERSCYTVTLSDPARMEPDGRTFDCDCPAHRFQRGGGYAACKHICFVLCRVVGYISELFFQTYRLDDAEVQMVLQQMSASRETILQSVEASRHSSQIAMGGAGAGSGEGEETETISRSNFLSSKRSLENIECPICFELVVDGTGRVNCPDCENHVHKECMEVWLTRKDTCVYCRSSKWRYFDDCVNHNRTLVLVNDDSDSDSDSDSD